MALEANKVELHTPQEAAEILRVKPGTLATWRSSRLVDLTFVKVGRRVFYRREDLLAFIENNLQEGGQHV